MSGRFLLDTNIVVPILNNDKALTQRLEGIRYFISIIVLGELYFGAYHSNRVAENIARINEFKRQSTILLCKDKTALIYGQIKQQLKLKGKPIPDNDAWIAATALRHQLVLATRDTHFTVVDGLSIEKW